MVNQAQGQGDRSPEKQGIAVRCDAFPLSDTMLPVLDICIREHLQTALKNRSEAVQAAAIPDETERIHNLIKLQETEYYRFVRSPMSVEERKLVTTAIGTCLKDALFEIFQGRQPVCDGPAPVQMLIAGIQNSINLKSPNETAEEVETKLVTQANRNFSFDDLLSREIDPARVGFLVAHGALLIVKEGINWVILRSDIGSAFSLNPDGVGCSYTAHGGWHYPGSEPTDSAANELAILALQRPFRTRNYLELRAQEFADLFDEVPESLSRRSAIVAPIVYGDIHLGAIVAFRPDTERKLAVPRKMRLLGWAHETAQVLARIQRNRSISKEFEEET